MWCSVRARANTTHIQKANGGGPVTGAPISPFNAAASVNMAIWLFFEVWLANMFRAFRPQYFVSSIVFSIFIQVAATYGTRLATMDEVSSLIKRLTQAFFAGFGLSAAVNVLILPFTSRKLAVLRIGNNFYSIQKALKAQRHFMQSLSSREWFSVLESGDVQCNSQQNTISWPEADSLKDAIMDIAKGFAEIKAELRYAKREAGWDHLGPKELVELTRLLKSILASILWMKSLIEVATRIEKRGGWDYFRGGSGISHPVTGEVEKQQWNWIFEQTLRPTEQLSQAMDDGIDHVACSLRFRKSPAASRSDREANADVAAKQLEQMIGNYLKQQQDPLKTWLSWKDMDSPFQVEALKSGQKPADSQIRKRHQLQLYFLLDLQYSFVETARRILDLVRYADSRVVDGVMKKKRLIIPTWKQMRKWFWALLAREDRELDYQNYTRRSGTVRVYLDDVLQTGTDAEHLPSETVWEKVTDKFRIVLRLFGSPESFFGFRVAVATMTIAIVAFLRNSQIFYIQQRLVWGSIMVAISMTETTGSGIYGQFERLLGTAAGMVLSYIDWYIVDGQPAGVIVFFGITMVLSNTLYLKLPTDPVLPTITMATVSLIVGYALQTKKVGIAGSETNLQQYHPLFVLSPYRLATVVAGVGVAFLFTNFPHGDKESPEKVLEKAHARMLAKEIVLLQGMKHHNTFLAWELTIGGRFPQDTYAKLVQHSLNMLCCSEIVVSIANSLESVLTITDSEFSETWLGCFKQLSTTLDSRSREVASLLHTISSAILDDKPIPFYLKAPKPCPLTELITDLDGGLFNVQRVCEPTYSAFAAMEITMALIADDASQLLSETKRLVGRLDFIKDYPTSASGPFADSEPYQRSGEILGS
ncbi:hypothetical protein N7474_001005 [Penicillium riverlandense]|uniref:uncharacterized protein n=1 Tax=Penicillium riverlandense TaxID=1903569 RepID=UPI0025485ABF|nr:uncharacterized protein N7474_001005 [Penicillium riverlandense]KAJ5832694.1 hypothetical protein N7474_001005 [Penicillium riverlandense]